MIKGMKSPYRIRVVVGCWRWRIPDRGTAHFTQHRMHRITSTWRTHLNWIIVTKGHHIREWGILSEYCAWLESGKSHRLVLHVLGNHILCSKVGSSFMSVVELHMFKIWNCVQEHFDGHTVARLCFALKLQTNKPQLRQERFRPVNKLLVGTTANLGDNFSSGANNYSDTREDEQ